MNGRLARGLALLLAASAGASPGQAAAGIVPDAPPVAVAPRSAVHLPAVVLAVDWRRVPAAPDADAGGGATDVVVGTRRPVPPGWTATRSAQAGPSAAVSTVRVMNGQEATWRLETTGRRRDHDFVWTAQGQGIVSHDTVVRQVRALRVRPSWAGGPAKVALSLAIELPGDVPPAPEARAGATVAATALETRLEVALDEWTPVARVDEDDLQVRVRRP